MLGVYEDALCLAGMILTSLPDLSSILSRSVTTLNLPINNVRSFFPPETRL